MSRQAPEVSQNMAQDVEQTKCLQDVSKNENHMHNHFSYVNFQFKEVKECAHPLQLHIFNCNFNTATRRVHHRQHDNDMWQ
jgi:hypothetical protein